MKSIFSTLIPESAKRRSRLIRSKYGALINGFPAKKLKIIGVTGTSGKSTTANLIHHILEYNGFKTGVISTVGAKAGRKKIDTGLHVTTPDPVQFQNILKFMLNRGIEYVIVEASSHALSQGRLGSIKFDHSVFTNIKRDHLDWHKTWEHYAASKAQLARKTKPEGHIIVNRDDKDMYEFLQKYLGSSPNMVTYSMNEPTNIEETAIGTKFELHGQEFRLPILGLYNVENALAAITISKLLGLSDSDIAKAVREFIGLEGRMQVMQPFPFLVIVDFAHNTDSLIKSLQTAQKLKTGYGKVITVFGSAGQRDVEKRYTMGEAALKYGDVVIVTAEDPRTEKLFDINTQIIEGAEKAGGELKARFANSQEYQNLNMEELKLHKGDIYAFDEDSVNSRYDAIEFAIKIAKDGDVVITQGKGHEQSLCFGKTEYPFTDQEAVERVLSRG